MNNTLLLLLVGAGAFLWYKQYKHKHPRKSTLLTRQSAGLGFIPSNVHPIFEQISASAAQAK